MGNGNALLHGLGALRPDDIGKGLGGMADDMDIHVVKTDFHGAAKTGGAELQRGIEAVFNFLFVLRNGIELFPLTLGEGGAVQPSLIFFFVVAHFARDPPCGKMSICDKRSLR